MKKKQITTAIRFAMGIGAFAAIMPFAGSAYAQDNSAEVDEVIVTGSRIKRTTNSESQSIITISSEDMKISGDVSVADALRSSTLNSLGSFRESSGSSAQSNATVNLRGAGAGRTLVLINGRRTVGSPSLGGGGTVNLNLIPFSFVDRLEIIADGASAVYGSDAVAGVVNVILKSGYDGMTFTARQGDRSKDDGSEQSFSFLVGASGDRSSVTFGLEHDSRDPIFDKDRSYTAARYSDLNGDGVIEGYSETEGVSVYGYTLLNPTYTGADFDENDRSTWYVTPGSNCVDDGSFTGEMKADQVFGPDSGYYCGYAYANVSANRASMERTNAWISSTFELNDDIELFADAVLSNNESFGRYAPPAAPGSALASDPRNPYGESVRGYFRWVDIGTRDNIVNDTLTDINIGMRATVSDTLSYEAYYTYSDYRSSSIGMYYLSYGGFAENIAEDITDYDTYVANLKATTLNDDRMNIQKVFFGAQWDMFEMDGGTASSYFAVESWDVNYSALVDAQSEAGLVGGSAGNSATGKRSVSALSAEAIFPVNDWLEVDTAIRFDDYDDFGNATSPRVGVKFTMIPKLELKMSYGQGFRAPDLSDLYGATSFSAESATDYYGCQQSGVSEDDCNSRQFDTYIGSNPNLGAESSETLSFGGTYEFMDGWFFSANYFTMTLEDAVEYVSAQDMLNVDYNTGGNNPAVTRGGNGGVTRIEAGYQNAVSEVERESLDFALNGSIDTDGFGSFVMAGSSTYYTKYETEAVFGSGELTDAVGLLGFPEWRTNAAIRWNMGDWSASWSADYIGESASAVSDTKYKAYTTHNVAVSYDMSDMGVVRVGANNVGNKDPLLDKFGSQVDEYQYSLTGRVIFLEYSIEM
jgi:iron complex outermembrane recepter protein